MIKEFNLEGKRIEVNASLGWLYEFRDRFGHDILPVLMPAVESVLAAIAGVLEDTGRPLADSKGEINAEVLAAAFNNESLVDAFIKLSGMEVKTVTDIFWALAKNADDSIPGPKEFLNSFEVFPMDQILPGMLSVIVESSVSSKKAKRLLTQIETATNKTRSISTSSPSQESIEG